MTTNKTERRGRPAKLQYDEFFQDAYNTLSNKDIANLYGVTVSAVQKMARRNDIRKTKTGRPGSMPDSAQLQELCMAHTDKEISIMYNVCPGTIAYWRKKLGITKYNKVA